MNMLLKKCEMYIYVMCQNSKQLLLSFEAMSLAGSRCTSIFDML